MAEADVNDLDAVFSCSACDARFSVAGALIAHLRRRHDITVLMCDLCGLDFERKEELVAHVANQHPPDEVEDEV
jgi:transcription elongation factor Elf1